MAKRFSEIREQAKADPERAARIEAHKQAIRDVLALAELRELRELRELTQQEVAEVLGVSQANVSRIERQNDVYLSTLAHYIEALGGKLELAAVFDDDVVALNVRELTPA